MPPSARDRANPVAPPLLHHLAQQRFFRVLAIVCRRDQSQDAIAAGCEAVAGSFLSKLADLRSQRGGLLGGQNRLAPIVDQGQLAQVVGFAQGPVHRPFAGRSVVRNGIIEGQREARFGQGSAALDEQVELPPALGFAFALPLEQAQPLGG